MRVKRITAWKPILLTVLGLYILVSLGFLFSISLPATRTGLLQVQRGQSQLLTNPEAASKAFNDASDTFESSFASLQNAPFFIKLAAPLPPFRWHVRLIKASHALSEAGKAAVPMVESFPKLDRSSTADLTPLFVTNSRNYHVWHATNSINTATVIAHLEEADRQLAGVPAWIAFGQRSELARLRTQVQQTLTTVSETDKFSKEVFATLGENDEENHVWEVQFIAPSSSNSLSLEASKGALTKANYETPGVKENLITVNLNFLVKLTELTGSLQIGGITVTPASNPELLVPTPANAEFLFTLYENFTEKPENLNNLLGRLKQGLKDGSIVITPTDQTLQDHINQVL